MGFVLEPFLFPSLRFVLDWLGVRLGMGKSKTCLTVARLSRRVNSLVASEVPAFSRDGRLQGKIKTICGLVKLACSNLA